MAGIDVKTNGYQLDGLDMSEALMGKSQVRKTPMFWEFGQQFVGQKKPDNAYQFRSPNIAVREGNWKLLVNYDGTDVELYNIAKDEKETNNVAEKNKRITSRLKDKAIGWFKESFRKYAGEL